MPLAWWGIATYLASRVKTDPTDREAARMLAVAMSCVVSFLIGATLGSWVAGVAVLAVLVTVLLGRAMTPAREQPARD